MQRGSSACLLEVRFSGPKADTAPIESLAMQSRRFIQQKIADTVLRVLPLRDGNALHEEGITLQDLEVLLRVRSDLPLEQIRPSVLLGAISHLQHAGLVASTANMPGDVFARRRYWRVRS
jgi:hypothetical protein